MGFKKVLTKRTIVWGATSVFLVGLMTTANILMRTQFNSLLDQVFGGPRAIVAENDDGIDFGQDFQTKKQAYDNGNKVTEEICEEGMILLRNENNALPLNSNAKVTVFGKNSVNLVYGGSGSAAPDKSGVRRTIFDSLNQAGIKYNQKLVDFYNDSSKSGKGRSENPAMENSGVPTLKTGETPVSSYSSDITNSYGDYGDAAIVVFSRIAGENWDLPRKADDNPQRHYLELDNNERALLKHIADSNKFQRIIILINGSNYIDLGFLKDNSVIDSSKISAVINIGSPGASGIMALGNILAGKVNPSGKTVDLVYTNYKDDPTWQNFGGNFTDGGDTYTSGSGAPTDYHVVEYEENIYMGYRYYETRGKDDAAWYNQNVVFPFGHGLSYTTFSQEITNKTDLEAAALTANGKFDVTVKVKNTGTKAGKDVVQLYVEAPYTAGGIEKPYKVLAGFGKSEMLAPGAEGTVTVSVDPYYFASFDNHDRNGDGFKGYTLDAGNYVFHLGKDSHTDIDTFTKTLGSTANIDKDPVTGKNVVPLFDNVSEGMKEELKRSDFAGTMPHTITDDERKINKAFLDKLRAYESGNTDTYTTMPTMGADLTVKFKDLVGLEYNDAKWDEFLNQLTFEEMLALFNEGCYSTTAITRKVNGEDYVLVPGTLSADGPTGLVSFLANMVPGTQPAIYDTCYYCSECLVAQTYNVELAKKQAHAIGNESLIGNERGDGLSYPGWYAPGVNLHRSPFSGRNTEYYSEDPLLCGKFAATVIAGVQEKGVYANVKHFALNDQETHRSAYGIATWADEQAIRELYLRSFEIAVKEGKSKGLMTSFNRIGTTWAGGDYRLCTTVLREEWGFVGSVICDFHTDTYMDSKQMLYAGGDLNLCSEATCKLKIGGGDNQVQKDSAKDANLLRKASHNLLYCIANSNIMKADILGYRNAVWSNVLTGATIGVGVGVAGWGAWAILSSLLKKPKVTDIAE
ncbi:MAG: glycoside hydrolase family 3 C-terminal domain-containing protein [Bacilli bacterium]|nr:glycoside hydrolase family 3 C-terminal domain-containing protein [Bacilli bacterium]